MIQGIDCWEKLDAIFFFNRYQDLMDKGEERKKKLEDSIQRYSVLRDAHELESWINDKVRVFCKDLATTNVHLS